MTGEHFGDHWIMRPGTEAEAILRRRSEDHLRSKFVPGTYDDSRVVNQIAQHQYRFFAETLSNLLPRVASRDFMAFVLNQYDDATKIEVLSKRGNLIPAQHALWDEIGPTFRRTAKYLAERICMLTPPADPMAPRASLEFMADQVWSAAEQMVEYAMMSEATHSVFPDRSITIIHEPGRETYLDQSFREVEFEEETVRMRRDLASRARFLPEADSIFHDIERQDRFLGAAMLQTVGVSYQAALQILGATINGSRPPPDGFPVPFVHLETPCREWQRHPELALGWYAGFSRGSRYVSKTCGRKVERFGSQSKSTERFDGDFSNSLM